MQDIREIFRYTKGLNKLIAIVTATSVIGSLLSFVMPFVIKLATDWIVAIAAGHASFSWTYLAMLGGILVGIALLTAASTDIGGYFGDQLAIRVRRQLSTTYYRHLLTLPQRYYDNEVSGKIINRLSRAISEITNFLQFFSNNLLQMLITLVLTIAILFAYSWPLAVLFVILIPANLYLTARTSGKWQALEKRKNTHFDIASGRFNEVIGQVRLVKSFGSEDREYRTFSRHFARMQSLTATQSRYWHTMNAGRGIVFGIINALLYVVLFYETANKHFSLGDMTMLLTLIAQVSFPLRNLSFFVDNYQRAVANSKDFIAAMHELPEPDDSATDALEVTSGRVEYDDVTFSYGDKKRVLHDISFTIEPGKKLALVGESGGGKTTISNLLMGLYRANNGAIRIDGQDITMVTRKSLRENIATVFQEAALFSGTIRENIAYANPEATDQEIEAAARAANALDFIREFDKTFDTEIGERGVKLSGGQKQRIAIARALLKNAPILILDEATSSLDSKSEVIVQQALERLMNGRTVLIIAHRLSTIAGVDTIVTLKHGRVDEIGAPAELARTGGIYSQLLELQTATSENAQERLAAFDMAS